MSNKIGLRGQFYIGPDRSFHVNQCVSNITRQNRPGRITSASRGRHEQRSLLIGFDLDDTLMDHTSAEKSAARKLYFEIKRRIPNDIAKTESDFVDRWKSVAAEQMARYLRREISFQDQRRCRIQTLFGQNIADPEADAIFSRFLVHYEASWSAFSDVLPSLDSLSHAHTLAVITNGDPSQQKKKLKLIGIENKFKFIITPTEAGEAKPSPIIFSFARDKSDTPVGDCVYIGNDLEQDVMAARGAGWAGIWLNREGESRSINDLLQIKSLHDLPEVLKKINNR